MDNFDKIIKQKVDQFEVPYNEAHWAEMDGRLNSIRAAKVKRNILGSAAVIGIIAISSYIIFPINESSIEKDDNAIIANDITPEIIKNDNNSLSLKEKIAISNNNAIEENVVVAEKNTEESEVVAVVEESNNENNVTVSNVSKENDKKVTNHPPVNHNTVNSGFIVYNNKVCLGEEVSFESFKNDQPVSYTWNFGDGTISHKPNPKHIYKDSHVYTVSLTLLNRQSGKEFTTIQEDIVSILPNPNTNFSYSEVSANHEDNKLKYPYTTFKIKEPNGQNSYKWSYGNGENSTTIDGKTIYKKAGNYNVTLITTNSSSGCINLIKKKISIKNGMDLFPPTAISPNSNISKNKVWIPGALLGWDVKFEMTISNKSGKTVYQTSDKNEPWNGRLNNTGQVLEQGGYLWQVVTYDAEGTPLRHNGQITLIK